MSSKNHELATAALLRAVRDFGDAHDRMSGGMKRGMGMNVSDVAALRLLIMSEDTKTPVTPARISRHLGISTASTTKLLDRLEASGHVERLPHPSDRRATVIVLTEAARQEFYTQFGERLARMKAAAEQFTPEQLADTAAVLAAMGSAMVQQ